MSERRAFQTVEYDEKNCKAPDRIFEDIFDSRQEPSPLEMNHFAVKEDTPSEVEWVIIMRCLAESKLLSH